MALVPNEVLGNAPLGGGAAARHQHLPDWLVRCWVAEQETEAQVFAVASS